MKTETIAEIVAVCVIALLVVVLVLCKVLMQAAEEHQRILTQGVEQTVTSAWAQENLHTGDILLIAAAGYFNFYAFQASAVTHTALVLELPPHMGFETKLVFEIHKKSRRPRDSRVLPLSQFLQVYASRGASLLVRRLRGPPIPVLPLMRAMREWGSRTFRDAVALEQVNSWLSEVPFFPLIPQPSRRGEEHTVYCSMAIAHILVQVGVLNECVLDLDRPHEILRPSEFALPPHLSSRRFPMAENLCEEYSWLPLIRVVQASSLLIAEAEMTGDFRYVRELKRNVRRDQRQLRTQAKREHRARSRSRLQELRERRRSS